jgi:hypothetical protein
MAVQRISSQQRRIRVPAEFDGGEKRPSSPRIKRKYAGKHDEPGCIGGIVSHPCEERKDGAPFVKLEITETANRTWATFHPRPRDFFPEAAASRGAVAAGFFFPSISARLCLSADIKSTTGASFFGFSTSAILPPSSLV